jgi:hypothetical protein
MMRMDRFWLAWVWLLAGTAAAYGQAAEASLSFGAGVFTDKNLGNFASTGGVTEALKLDSGFRLSARLDLNSWRFLSHEFGYGYQRSKLDFGSAGNVGMSVHHGFYDMLLHALPEGSPVRPFVCGGGGFTSFFPPGASVFSGNGITKFGFNYGAGVKVRVTPIYGFRLDLRDSVTGKPFDENDGILNARGLLHNVEMTAGFSILF